MITDVAVCFTKEDIIERVLDTPVCYAPSQKIDKCTVVCLQAGFRKADNSER